MGTGEPDAPLVRTPRNSTLQKELPSIVPTNARFCLRDQSHWQLREVSLRSIVIGQLERELPICLRHAAWRSNLSPIAQGLFGRCYLKWFSGNIGISFW